MEEVDVAIVGAGVAGLSVAIALNKVNPRLRIKVLDSRVAPTGKYGGFVKLQPNGLKAASAISQQLLAGLRRIGLHEKRTLLHGEDGKLITRLDSYEDFSPSPAYEYDTEDLDTHTRHTSGGGGIAGAAKRGLARASGVHAAGRGGAGGGTGMLFDPELVVGEEEEEEWAASSRRRDKNGHSIRDRMVSLARTESQALVEARRWHNIDETSPNMIVGWTELERLLISLLPAHTVEYQAQFLKYHESEGGVVALFEGLAYPLRARILLGCDGAFSIVRAQCVQDSEPAYDRTVRFMGRLDGHQVSTTPLDYSAWWIKRGQVFVSHPLADGDVAWEALVTDRELHAAGYAFDESMGRVLPEDPTQLRELKEKGQLNELPPSQALIQIFKGWPRSVDQMVRFTPSDAVIENGVYIRSASDMPPSMGKGRVAILGEAAHPLRPTNQDVNMALEDAAELAAFVQEYGVTKEALRRYDVARRPRWRHVMQLTATQGALTTTGAALSQGVMNYTQDLYQRDFEPLGKEGRRAAAKALRGGHTHRGGWGHGLVRLLRTGVTLGLISSGVLLASNLLPLVDNETSLTHTDTLTEDDNNDNTQTVTDAQGAVLVVSRRERRRAERALRGTGRVMRRGVQRLGGAIQSVGAALSHTQAGRIAHHEAKVVKHAVGSTVVDTTATALDSAATVVGNAAKKTLRHRIAEALGFF